MSKLQVKFRRQVISKDVFLLQNAVLLLGEKIYTYCCKELYLKILSTISKDTQFTELLLRLSPTMLGTTEAQINFKNLSSVAEFSLNFWNFFRN